MGKIARRIPDTAPITETPAYKYLLAHATAITNLIKKTEEVASKPGGQGLMTSIQRRVPVEWDRAVWKACKRFGPEEVRVAGRCLRKRSLLEFLPATDAPQTGLRMFPGGKK